MIKNDPWLAPFEDAIEGRHDAFLSTVNKITNDNKVTLAEFASGHQYFGLHATPNGWIFREWAPNATAIYLIGDCNGWSKEEAYRLKPLKGGVWELELDALSLAHGQRYKLWIEWQGGAAERIPAWARRVVQDEATYLFSAQVWQPDKPYKWKKRAFKPKRTPLLIYECHIGMGTNEERVGSYSEFQQNVLPRVARLGYNAIQIMAIQEHPYYGSFGYHVSNFFAASSRFGTPEELKALIDEAHRLGIAVIMDIVHSHAVKNELEGLGLFDGTRYQYFHEGARGEHPAWDSYCFNYAKTEVIHFLLSNCRYWLEEYRFDGFRFDGVTSMLYHSHGLGEAFGGYQDYYNLNQDGDAITYLTLANQLIHEVNPNAITIAEEVSGMPGLASPIADGGYGFDYRMAMNIPDYWIKIIKEKKDEEWSMRGIWWETTNRRQDEQTISYAESHDQALVGDKTIIFRLIDADMYWHMGKMDNTGTVERGIQLHKLIRLVTMATINGGYLNFMGNEFGHPEWIDFPREGNGWSYQHARRQWELVDNPALKFHWLSDWDRDALAVLQSIPRLNTTPIIQRCANDEDQVLAFQRKGLLFVFSFNPDKAFTDYGILVERGEYELILSSDSSLYGGYDRINANASYLTHPDPLYKKEKKEWLQLYLPPRTALVFRKLKKTKK